MRILITNDDGINAPGLKTLQKIAETLAGAAGEVWTVAPSTERSGVAHAISLSSPVLISQLGPRYFSVDGYPADCVLAGLHHILKGSPPDIILSGVNRGNNSAENALYSGTLGAAIEGALQGVPSFALSQYLGPNNVNINDPFEASAAYGAEVVQAILSANPPASQEYQLFYNINFPPCPAEWVKGRKLATQGFRRGSNFSTEPYTAANRRNFLFIKGGDQQVATAPESDAAANLENYISITPMRADFTDHKALDALKAIE